LPKWPGLAADSDGCSIVAPSYRDIANTFRAGHGERRKSTRRRGYYRSQFESAWARYCAEGVTASQPSNVAYIGNR
jgi:hypothetical protein